ncbi:MAG: penicillin-binding transpeptidase domain-containing protein, partial [Gemmatimonadota bacterium]|nr:penicillin-binding transpeptidase domain-containing protein [Gemmatimonadota bacterium]
GRVVDPRASVGALAPEPGEDLKLTLDVELQKYIHEVFPDSMKGAVVAMVPSTGEILAMYSHPTYDPNDFVGGIRSSLWAALREDSMIPLLDRTTIALYPPASTFKTATAAMGIREGILTAETRMPIACNGGMAYAGRYSRCWKRSGHGSLTLPEAIEQSCNVYFYQVGIRLGLKKVIEEGTRMGLTRRTGIDLPAERSGIYPTEVPWYQRRFNTPAVPSDVMALAIGQGPNSQSVLRMAYLYSAIAGDGSAPEPHLAANVRLAAANSTDPGEIDLGMTPDQLAILWEGLRLVTESRGTAVQSSLERYKLYGKTGTAQNAGADHAWFVGFAGVPGRNPDITVAVIVEHGLHGDAAAPLAAKVANFYLDRKYGQPFDPIPTWGERVRAGRLWEFDPPGRRLVPPTSTRRAQPASAAPAKTR